MTIEFIAPFNLRMQFIVGAILNLLAWLDTSELIDYTVKAVIGGFVWLFFQVFASRVDVWLRKRKQQNSASNSERSET
jgi:hypothetical protein